MKHSIESGLEIAVDVQLSDPQGFFNPGSKQNAIQFMDIHIGSSSKAQELLEKVQERIKALVP